MGVFGMTEEPKLQDKDAQESEESNRWGKIKGYFFDNPALALTLLYIYVTVIGMIYSAALYGSFGINIFNYSEIADFLFAALKNPSVPLLAAAQVATIIFVIGVIWSLGIMMARAGTGELERSSEREPSRVLTYAQVGVFVVVSLIFPYLVATHTAFSIKNGEKPVVEVRYSSSSGSAEQVTVPELEFIGATQRAAFFYDADDKRTIVIPQSQIVSIEVPE